MIWKFPGSDIRSYQRIIISFAYGSNMFFLIPYEVKTHKKILFQFLLIIKWDDVWNDRSIYMIFFSSSILPYLWCLRICLLFRFWSSFSGETRGGFGFLSSQSICTLASKAFKTSTQWSWRRKVSGRDIRDRLEIFAPINEWIITSRKIFIKSIIK